MWIGGIVSFSLFNYSYSTTTVVEGFQAVVDNASANSTTLEVPLPGGRLLEVPEGRHRRLGRGSDRGWNALSELREDLFVLRKTARLVLRVDELAVHDDVEDALASGKQLGLVVEIASDRGRQTGGLREVVSSDAIGDGDVHGSVL